jgi:hypothetical protein
MMKKLLYILILLPFAIFAQTLKVNNSMTVSSSGNLTVDTVTTTTNIVSGAPGIGVYVNGSGSEGIELKNTLDAAINILNPDGYGYGIYIANGRVQIDDTTDINATLTATKIKTVTDLPYNKVLSNNTSTTIMTVTAPSDSSTNGNSIGGTISYSISVKGSNGYQSESGIIRLSAVNYNGILTIDINTDTDKSQALSSGTLTSSYDITYSTGVYSIKVLFNSDLTSPVLNFEYNIKIKGGTKTAQ